MIMIFAGYHHLYICRDNVCSQYFDKSLHKCSTYGHVRFFQKQAIIVERETERQRDRERETETERERDIEREKKIFIYLKKKKFSV